MAGKPAALRRVEPIQDWVDRQIARLISLHPKDGNKVSNKSREAARAVVIGLSSSGGRGRPSEIALRDNGTFRVVYGDEYDGEVALYFGDNGTITYSSSEARPRPEPAPAPEPDPAPPAEQPQDEKPVDQPAEPSKF